MVKAKKDEELWFRGKNWVRGTFISFYLFMYYSAVNEIENEK